MGIKIKLTTIYESILSLNLSKTFYNGIEQLFHKGNTELLYTLI